MIDTTGIALIPLGRGDRYAAERACSGAVSERRWTPNVYCRECGRPRERGYPPLCPRCQEAWREQLMKEKEHVESKE